MTERELNLKTRVNGWEISTVDLMGIDHGFGDDSLFYETMVFQPDSDQPYADHYMERYPTVEKARAGHERIVAEYRERHD